MSDDGTGLVCDASCRLEALMKASVDAIVVIDGQGLVVSFNQAAEQMFGYPASEILQQNISRLMPEPYRSRHDGYLRRYKETGQAKIIGIGREMVAQRRDGSVFPIFLSIGEIHDHERWCFLGIIHDITARKDAEKKLREQQQRLTYISRLGVLGEMSAGIAHEVNQPLTAISAYAQACIRMLSTEQPDLSEITEVIRSINEQALRGGEVIQRLRSLAMQNDGDLVETDINELIDELAELTTADARIHDINIITDLDRSLPAVTVDPIQIQQVLLNLIHNGIDAMRDEDCTNNSIIVQTTEHTRHQIKVSVTDHGHGVPESMRSKLFEPFQTSKDYGMGIGLSISRSIIISHGGSLKYEPGVDQGTVFYFTLPVISAD